LVTDIHPLKAENGGRIGEFAAEERHRSDHLSQGELYGNDQASFEDRL
jgi:hypothetical protein